MNKVKKIIRKKRNEKVKRNKVNEMKEKNKKRGV